MEFTISQNEINSLKKGVEGQGNLKFKTSDTPDDRLKFTITSEDLTSFKEMDTPEDKDLKSAMAMAFGFLKAEVNYVEDMLELKADKEIIEYKFDVIHAELIEIKEILKEMK